MRAALPLLRTIRTRRDLGCAGLQSIRSRTQKVMAAAAPDPPAWVAALENTAGIAKLSPGQPYWQARIARLPLLSVCM